MNTQTLTARIAALPDKTRHLCAGIIAWRLSPKEQEGASAEWAAIWAHAKDHGKHYEWPTVEELRGALESCGISDGVIRAALRTYDSYGPNVPTAAPIAHHYGRHIATWADKNLGGAVDSKYDWSGGEV